MSSPTIGQRIRALLATGRVANLPTVATNVLVAVLLAPVFRGIDPTLVHPPTHFLFEITFGVILASMFYVGGCLLGDATDAPYDAVHRPERPLPQGILPAGWIGFAAWILLGSAWIMGSLFNFIHLAVYMSPETWRLFVLSSFFTAIVSPYQIAASTLLVGAIILYAKFHKRLGPRAAPLMGLCRALLAIWAAVCACRDSDLPVLNYSVIAFALTLFLYTLGISLVARHESSPNPALPSRLVQFLFVLPVFVPATLFITWHIVPFITSPSSLDLSLLIVTAGIFLAWCIRSLFVLRKSVPSFVSMALAGFCLLDACFASLIGWQIVLVCIGFFLFALLLQRIAPAT